MATLPGTLFRLGRAGFVLAQHGVRFVPKGVKVPFVLHLARAAVMPIVWLTLPFRRRGPKADRVSAALTTLGPSYVKLGQFMATRADVIGPDLARDLSNLQDRQPPFSMREARRAIEESLGGRLEDHFVEFGPPVAAASIAQVHKAVVVDNGVRRAVAVKILRPGVERQFARDLDSYFFAARLIERWLPPVRRLKPVAVVENLARTTELEMDLRLEAAAISEMADNIVNDKPENGVGFRVPTVDWRRTQRRVLTLEWIDGVPLSQRDRIVAAGHDPKALGQTVLRAFLRHAMRDGFFHADMHHGNLLMDEAGNIVAVDFGIMGRLGLKERRFLAEILHGLITRNYRRAAEIHFEAGYVPAHHQVEVFAQAMRAIGEPIHGRTAAEISMADLLGQLFAYTQVFDMETRPELILLQKSMVIVEGVARSLDPELNLWTAAEPIAKEWLAANYGVIGRLAEAQGGAGEVAKVLADVPSLMTDAARASHAFARMADSGLRLDQGTIEAIASATAEQGRTRRRVAWAAATIVLVALVLLSLHTPLTAFIQ